MTPRGSLVSESPQLASHPCSAKYRFQFSSVSSRRLDTSGITNQAQRAPRTAKPEPTRKAVWAPLD